MTISNFNCTKCGQCCRNLSDNRIVILFPGEAEKISMHLYGSPSHKNRFSKPVRIEKIETTLLKIRDNGGNCVFLLANDQCGIHDTKPYQCLHSPQSFMTEHAVDYPCITSEQIAETNSHDRDVEVFRNLFINKDP